MAEPLIVREIARALAESATLAEAAPRMLAAVCESLGWEYGALWEGDRRGRTLHCVGTWHHASPPASPLLDCSRPPPLRRRARLPGRLPDSPRTAWIPPVLTSSNSA